MSQKPTTAFIICGALAREVLAIIKKHQWNVDVVGVAASHHMVPQKIAPDVEKRILELREQYERLIVVYGDCGTYGALDAVLEKYNIERIAGPHCYEMYGGDYFNEVMDTDPGTYFLTDFLLRTFKGSIIKGMGLDRYPELKEMYFKHYKKVVYLVQNRDPKLDAKAQEAADFLELPLEIRETGYNLLETRLVELMQADQPANT